MTINEEVYTCEICGFEQGWEESDEKHGEMWGCEICSKIFCSKCGIERIGTENYYKMMQSGEYIRCPECFLGGVKDV